MRTPAKKAAPKKAAAKKATATNAASKKAAKKTTAASSRKAAPKKASSVEYSIEHSKLMKLFEDELKDIYWAEKALTKALPKMAKQATSPELKQALEMHLQETEMQVEKLEQVFDLIGKKAQAKKCEAMAGLVKEADEIMKECDKGAMRDAGIITAGQKVEHYEIASYGSLRTFAQVLELDEAASILEEILDEEKAADEKLTEVAMATINVQAAEEDEEEEEEEEEDDEESEDEETEDDEDTSKKNKQR